MATGIHYIKLKSLYDFSVKENFVCEVYSSNKPNKDNIAMAWQWEWMPLTKEVLYAVLVNSIIVTNFRRAKIDYDSDAVTGNQQHKPKLLYPARKTGKKYNHTVTIDLYKIDVKPIFRDPDDESGCCPPRRNSR